MIQANETYFRNEVSSPILLSGVELPVQDEDHSGSPPHSFPGLFYVNSGMFPERFRSSPELAGS